MNKRLISDITRFIFMRDIPQRADIIFIPGSSKSVICCQAFHARRAFMSYSYFFRDTEFFVVPTATQNIAEDNWYKTEHGYNKVMGEVAKCGIYFKDLGRDFE